MRDGEEGEGVFVEGGGAAPTTPADAEGLIFPISSPFLLRSFSCFDCSTNALYQIWRTEYKNWE